MALSDVLRREVEGILSGRKADPMRPPKRNGLVDLWSLSRMLDKCIRERLEVQVTPAPRTSGLCRDISVCLR
jgi:hypothetical protein